MERIINSIAAEVVAMKNGSLYHDINEHGFDGFVSVKKSSNGFCVDMHDTYLFSGEDEIKDFPDKLISILHEKGLLSDMTLVPKFFSTKHSGMDDEFMNEI